MNKIILLIITLSACLHLSAQEKSRKNVIRLNGGAVVGITDLSYERAVAKRFSIIVAPSFSYLTSEEATYKTYGGSGSIRYYLSKSKIAPAGFYVGAGSGYAVGQATVPNYPAVDVTAVNVYGVFGHQWIWSKGWCVDGNIGLQHVNIDYKSTEFKVRSYVHVLPAFTIGVGKAF